MKTIYKYPIDIADSQTIYIPELCEDNVIVSFKDQYMKIENQFHIPYIWVMVDTERTSRAVEIVIKGTGCDCSDISMRRYLGTFQYLDGNLVWHVFWK